MSAQFEKRSFKYYSHLPPALQRMVIDKLRADDKSTLSRCSKATNIAVKTSNKYIYGLEFHAYSEDFLQIEVVHGQYKHYDDRCYGFMYQFRVEKNQKIMEFTTLNEKRLWYRKLEESTDLVAYAANHFKTILQTHQRKISKLFIDHMFDALGSRSFDLELKHLRSLKELKFQDTAGLEQITSKIHHPLTFFHITGEKISKDLGNFIHLHEVSNILQTPDLEINFEEFQQLEASWIEMSIQKLNEQDIIDLVRLWKNGQFQNKKYIRWYLKNSSFDLTQLFKHFHINFNIANEIETLLIEHNTERGKKAELHFEITPQEDHILSFREIEDPLSNWF